jgi:hypothetical protein
MGYKYAPDKKIVGFKVDDPNYKVHSSRNFIDQPVDKTWEAMCEYAFDISQDNRYIDYLSMCPTIHPDDIFSYAYKTKTPYQYVYMYFTEGRYLAGFKVHSTKDREYSSSYSISDYGLEGAWRLSCAESAKVNNLPRKEVKACPREYYDLLNEKNKLNNTPALDLSHIHIYGLSVPPARELREYVIPEVTHPIIVNHLKDPNTNKYGITPVYDKDHPGRLFGFSVHKHEDNTDQIVELTSSNPYALKVAWEKAFRIAQSLYFGISQDRVIPPCPISYFVDVMSIFPRKEETISTEECFKRNDAMPEEPAPVKDLELVIRFDTDGLVVSNNCEDDVVTYIEASEFDRLRKIMDAYEALTKSLS